MTRSEAIKSIKALGFTCIVQDGEYRIAPKELPSDQQEKQAYYTNDIQDALDTALSMYLQKGRTQ